MWVMGPDFVVDRRTSLEVEQQPIAHLPEAPEERCQERKFNFTRRRVVLKVRIADVLV